MKIVFKSTGSTTGFENWLKSFKEITDSLLIEIDLFSQKFVSKAFTDDHTIVKYGHLSFDDAGIRVESIFDNDNNEITLDGWNAANGETRIKLGIFQVLARFIKVVNVYSGTDNYTITVDFISDGNNFVGCKVTFKSLALEMSFICSDIADFVYIDDDKFLNHVSKIENSIDFEVCVDANKFLLDIAAIASIDQKKDVIEFSTKNDGKEWSLHTIDPIGGSYNYTIAYLSAESPCTPMEVSVSIPRWAYILATKSDQTNNVISLAGEEDASRMKITSKNFVTVIASIRMAEE